jgi:spore coat protein H
MPPPKSRSPWKVLIVALLVCTICFVLAVAGLAYWFLSTVAGHQKAKGERQVAQQEQRVPRKSARRLDAPFSEGGSTNSFGNGGSSTNLLQAAERGSSTGDANVRGPIRNAAGPPPKANRPAAGDEIFNDVFVPKLQIDISVAARARLTMSPRTYVRADIREGEKVYKDVAIRLKGGPGSFQPLYRTPSFTLNFDKFTEGQTFHGLKKIHLNGSVQDHSYLNEKICRELFEAAGVPVPRAGHAIVALNGDEPRLFVLLEGVNKQFLKRYFKDANGNVYDGHSGTDVTSELPLNSGEEKYTRLEHLADAARERNLETRRQKLEQTLDVDRFLTFVAMEMILGHWDGYTVGLNNYRIAHDRDTDRMVFIPHGMDQMLGDAHQPILIPSARGLVARSVLQVPELRARYEDRVAELSTNVFRVPVIQERVREVAAKVAQALEGVDPQLAKNFRDKIGPSYCRKVRQRAARVAREINPTARPQIQNAVKFDQSASIALTNWSSKIDLPEAQLTQKKDEDGNVLLYIGTKTGCTASWRTTVTLEPGRYRMEARIKTKGVVLAADDPRAGAGLRASRVRTGQRNEGDHDWMPVHFDFNVQQEGEDKELVCELRADEGEIWYELKSLKLKKL